MLKQYKEVIITKTKKPRLTITPTRITIKHDGKKPYTAELELFDLIIDELKDTKESLRGHVYNNIISMYNGRQTQLIKSYKLVR